MAGRLLHSAQPEKVILLNISIAMPRTEGTMQFLFLLWFAV